ncbi:hypothetical protein DFH29DRAFT_932420 [Suillus ampliporus]|nr:hypothetical protein DFH29DRAFT_932420 [Suillus ampliporus]
MSTPSRLPPFDSSATSTGMVQLLDKPGPEWLTFYIKLIPTEMLRTELYLLYILLKDRAYPGDLRQIVGLHVMEAQNEESLQSTSGDRERRGIAERIFIEAKWARCRMEVSLYNQTIEHIEQRRFTPMRPITVQLEHDVTVHERCKTWLMGLDTDLIPAKEHSLIKNASPPDGSTPVAISHSALAYHNKRTSIFVGPLFPLLSTWVTADVQQTFDEARRAELTSQVGLMLAYIDVKSSRIPQRNIQSELLLLREKMCRARAEVEFYTMAIKNARELDDSDSDRIPPPPPDEMCYCDEDSDDYSTDYDFDCDDFW